LEFLIPEKGKGQPAALKIPSLNITATPLRFLYILGDNPLPVAYQGIEVLVPAPQAFVLQKLLILSSRTNKDKYNKDLDSIMSISKFIILDPELQRVFIYMFNSLPKTTRKTILRVLIEIDFPFREFVQHLRQQL